MVLRPQGLFPERRRNIEFHSEAAAADSMLTEPSSTPGGTA